MSKLGNLDRFQDGPTAARRKHNDVVHTVNYLMRKANEEVIVARASGGLPPLMCEDEEEEEEG